MKVIMLQDVAKIGKRFSVADVSSGYAMNKLIPKGMAEPATPANLKKIERRQAETDAVNAADTVNFNAAKDTLAKEALVIKVEANDKGHLFKAVHEADIVAAATAVDIALTENMLAIAQPIKEVGEHTITLASGADTAKFTINVEVN